MTGQAPRSPLLVLMTGRGIQSGPDRPVVGTLPDDDRDQPPGGERRVLFVGGSDHAGRGPDAQGAGGCHRGGCEAQAEDDVLQDQAWIHHRENGAAGLGHYSGG
eukprot:836392-Pyramimonas_sp.AAC.1